MKIVFMGTPDFAAGNLKALIGSGHEIAAVFSQPDKPKGRGKKFIPTPVKEVAEEAGIEVYQPVKIREPENLEILKRIDPDVIVVVAFGQLIPKSILDLPKYGCVNVHASLLPAYRGAAPIQWAVINGEEESGVTTMRMDTGLDTGDMLLQKKIRLADDETGGSLFDRLMEVGSETLLETLKGLEEGSIIPEKQPVESTTEYAKMLKKDMGKIDFTRPAVEIERLIRGLNPWPSAYTALQGKTLKVWRAFVQPSKDRETHCPGEVLGSSRTGLLVQTGDGILEITELQLEGKKRMDTASFLRGFTVDTGTILGKE